MIIRKVFNEAREFIGILRMDGFEEVFTRADEISPEGLVNLGISHNTDSRIRMLEQAIGHMEDQLSAVSRNAKEAHKKISGRITDTKILIQQLEGLKEKQL